MNPIDVIKDYYVPGSKTYDILLQHGLAVADMSVGLAQKISHLNPDLDFIWEAAVLHDIGIFMTHAPDIGCVGQYPYVCHGYLGRELLDQRGIPGHGLVCERHVGAGISMADILREDLPLPQRDMIPQSIEEQIVCYADKFFSKNGRSLTDAHTVREIEASLKRYGDEKVERFSRWKALFGS